jgi:tetratricopeptide (TPR) repeat protein
LISWDAVRPDELFQKTLEYLADVQSMYTASEPLHRMFDSQKWLTSIFTSEEFVNKLLAIPETRHVFATRKTLLLQDVIFMQRFYDESDEWITEDVRNNFFTEYEDAFTSSVIWAFSRAALLAFKYLETSLPETLAFGTLPLGGANARVLPSPVGGKILVFNTGLFSLLYLISKNIALSYRVIECDGTARISMESEVLPRPEAAKAFNDYITRGYCGDPTRDIVNYVDTPAFPLMAKFFRYMSFFVVSHELAHLALLDGETEKLLTDPFSLSKPIVSITGHDVEATPNWRAEFFADELAANAVFHYSLSRVQTEAETPDIMYALLSIELFYSILYLLHDALGIGETETHPSIVRRRRRLRLVNRATTWIPDSLMDMIEEWAAHNEKIFRGVLNAKEGEPFAENEGAVDGTDTNVTETLNDLAVLLQEKGDLVEARRVHERVLAIRENSPGSDHPDTALTLHNLALVLKQQEDLTAARHLYERALAIREKFLGASHPHTAKTLNNLARVLHESGDLSAARTLCERALDIRTKVLDPDDPDIAESLNNLAFLLQDLGDHTQVPALFDRALAIWEKAHGSDHPNVALALNNIGLLEFQRGDLATAATYLDRAVAIWEKALGPDHPSTARGQSNCAYLLLANDEPLEAARLCRAALAVQDEKLGAAHPWTKETATGLALALVALGDMTDAARVCAHYEIAVPGVE